MRGLQLLMSSLRMVQKPQMSGRLLTSSAESCRSVHVDRLEGKCANVYGFICTKKGALVSSAETFSRKSFKREKKEKKERAILKADFLKLYLDSFLRAMGSMAPSSFGFSSHPSSPFTSKERRFLPLWLQPVNNLKNDLHWINRGCILLPKPNTKPGRWVSGNCLPLAKVNNNGIPGGAVHEDQSSRTSSKTENDEDETEAKSFSETGLRSYEKTAEPCFHPQFGSRDYTPSPHHLSLHCSTLGR
ncbi:uncharacterized protein LOC123859441 isoform X2 [Mirounga angustirostris]